MKYVLTTGCSFTKNKRLDVNTLDQDLTTDTRASWPEFLQDELGENYTVMNLGSATNDNVSMVRIMLYHIDRLIEEGVDGKDIICITQWSDPVRESVYIKKEYNEEIEKFGHLLYYTPTWKTDGGVFYLTGGFSPPDGAKDYLGISNAIKYWELEVNWNNILNQTMQWLEIWLLLEKTCDELNIKTYYMSMRNPYSQEAYECHFGAPENNSDVPTKKLWFDDYEILKPYVAKLPINSPNHWHYKNYNGLLEWTIDNRIDGVDVFQESLNMTYEEYLKIQSNGWGHPSPEMMKKFVKEELLLML